MRMKASAYKQYGDAAVMALVLEALPQVKKSAYIYTFKCGNLARKNEGERFCRTALPLLDR